MYYILIARILSLPPILAFWFGADFLLWDINLSILLVSGWVNELFILLWNINFKEQHYNFFLYAKNNRSILWFRVPCPEDYKLWNWPEELAWRFQSFLTGLWKVLVSEWLWVFGPLSGPLSLNIGFSRTFRLPSFSPPSCPDSSGLYHLLSHFHQHPPLFLSSSPPSSQHPLDPHPGASQNPHRLHGPQTEPAVFPTPNWSYLSFSRFANSGPLLLLLSSASLGTKSQCC